MSFHAKQTNLKKLTFLGFGKHSDTNLNDGLNEANSMEVRLDDECAKVFAMEMDNDGLQLFDVDRLHDDSTILNEPKQYGENEYNLHRKRSYPHPHVPLRAAKSLRRNATSPHLTQNIIFPDTPLRSPGSPTSTIKISSPGTIQTPSSIESSLFHITDNTVLYHNHQNGGLTNLTDEEEALSSESECILSDPTGYRSPPELSPERKVQFSSKSNEADSSIRKKHKRSRHHIAKSRKYSLPENPSNRKQIGSEKREGNAQGKNHRISTQPEDLPLRETDRDQLDSHRSDDQRNLRRYKPSKPSIVRIARRGGLDQLPVRKMYDHSPHAIFVQLDELVLVQEEKEWKETARWIKYEEDVEEGVDRWGRPHVASLSFHSLLNLRKCLEEGLVNLDMEEQDLPGIAYRVCEDLYKEDLIREEDKVLLMRILLLRHRHVNEHHERGFKFSRKHSYTSLQNLHDVEKRKVSLPIKHNHGLDIDGNGPVGSTIIDIKEETYATSSEDIKKAQNETILKRIPEGAQGTSVLVGDVDFLEQPAVAFIRLAEGVSIPSLIEVNIPVRFIFILLGPKGANLDYHEVGRSISTLMANQQFHNIAYEAYNRKALLSAINEFLDDSIVLPPGNWERQALLPIEEIKAKSEAIRKRKENALKKEPIEETKALLASGDDKKPPFQNPLIRTRRPFGGLINDLKRRYPYYKHDIINGLNTQCAAASLFMYFAALSGAITFGGLMSDKTRNDIGISETLIATSFSGIIFALLAGQPLMIVGSTGPLLLFDESLYQFCELNQIDYLTTRLYIGLWLGVLALFVASLEGSVFVKLFTRFTEDIFSSLISLIYIVESVMRLFKVFRRHPLLANYCNTNGTGTNFNSTAGDSEKLHIVQNGSLVSVLQTHDAFGPLNQPNTALFCTILSLGTFAIAYYLLLFRNSQFLGRSARRALGDFGVPIALIIMVTLDYFVPDTYTEKLSVPEGLTPSNPDVRGWIINPSGNKGSFPLWVAWAAGIPAMLVYILLFMETHIAELIIDKPERKLKKGSGFHLDIVIICLLNVACGFIGAPWMCVATVRSVAHVSALTVMSRTHAPGEKPHIIEVKEQRVSALCVATFVGLSVLMSPLLRLIPMSVLFGVFLYMGIASTNGIQFFDRIKLFFMPVKHHPQASYVRKVRSAKMHLFTAIQLTCLALLWIVRSTDASLAFPFFLLLLVPLRAQLKYIFSPTELRAIFTRVAVKLTERISRYSSKLNWCEWYQHSHKHELGWR